jgi:hypothetical protein
LFEEFLSMMKRMKKDSSAISGSDDNVTSSQKKEADSEVLRRLRNISDRDKEREKEEEERIINEQKKLFRKKKRKVDEAMRSSKLMESLSSLISSSGRIEWGHSSFGGIFGSVDGKRKFSISKGIFLYTLKYKKFASDGKGGICVVNVVKNSPDVAKLKKLAEDDLNSAL